MASHTHAPRKHVPVDQDPRQRLHNLEEALRGFLGEIEQRRDYARANSKDESHSEQFRIAQGGKARALLDVAEGLESLLYRHGVIAGIKDSKKHKNKGYNRVAIKEGPK